MTRPTLIDVASNAVRRLRQAIREFQQRRASIDEVARLDQQGATSFAHDLGVSANELCALAAKDANSADLLVRRMKTIGLEPAGVDPAVMRDLQRCCSLCRDKGLCVHELEDQPREPTWPAYCPNEQTLAALSNRADDATPACPQPTGDAAKQSEH